MKIVTATPTEGCHHRKRLTAAPGTSHTLLIIKPLGWHVRLIDSLERTDIYADLHGRRYRQHIDFAGTPIDRPVDISIAVHEYAFEATKLIGVITDLAGQLLAMNPKRTRTIMHSAFYLASKKMTVPQFRYRT
jgi:hypothetical protein